MVAVIIRIRRERNCYSLSIPNDEAEQDRLNMFHPALVHIAAGGKLFFAPIENFGGFRILDIGTGTDPWERSQPYSAAMGTLQREIHVDDVESLTVGPWPAVRFHTFPLHRSRARNLKPGGWVEFQDYESPIHTEDGSLSPESNFVKMQPLLDEGLPKNGTGLKSWPETGEMGEGCRLCQCQGSHLEGAYWHLAKG
ncbi:hypothetical protein EMCG_07300 [[Emmonsia] crescens]|uniref:Uncharacterized protein n=1 Tax=[Emmonsia] crescens TaxID=73230 RepID=A0A0G2I9S9_9EURO|nr:hypothetical protein EMCG_07300 [Emmonsia crescens UAMH 3008]